MSDSKRLNLKSDIYILFWLSYNLIYKIVSLKYPILDIYFPRGYV